MTHLFVIALEIKMTDMLKQIVPVCCVELVNAHQGVKQISWALGEHSEHTGLQLLQLGARLQKTTKNQSNTGLVKMAVIQWWLKAQPV